jgi:hypothetical protein
VYPLTAELLHEIDAVEGWFVELTRLRTVVCGTGRRDYALEPVEPTGPAKYAPVGISFVSPVPSFTQSARR